MAKQRVSDLFSASELVLALGFDISQKQRVMNMARKLGLGQKVGWSWVFTRGEYDKLKDVFNQ